MRCYSEHKPSCRVARGYDSGRQADGTGVGRGAVQAQAQPAFCGLPQRWSRGRLALEPAVSPSLSSPSMCAGAGGPHLPTCLRLPGQALSPQRIPAAVTPPPLMSPLVFAQPSWAPLQERSRAPLPAGNQDPAATPPGLLLPLRTPEPSGTPGSALSKLQLQEALLHLIQVGSTAPSSASPRAPCPLLLPKNQRVMRQPRASRRMRPLLRVLSLEEGLVPSSAGKEEAGTTPATGGSLAWGRWEPAGGGEAALSPGEGAVGTAGAAVTAQACFTEILKACSEDGVG